MKCEVIAIGTELLLGQIIDSNSAWMGEQLALAGIDSFYQTKVGDNQTRMVECLRLALDRSDTVICCGGLGPTQDDITREAIAEVMGTKLVRQGWIAEHIRDMFKKRGRDMAPSNLRQADVPEGAEPIEQMPGTAPGLVCPIGEKVIYAVPGVPHEMRTMLEGTVLPDLKRRAGVTSVIRSRVLKTWGYTESGLADLLAHHIAELDQSGRATIAFQASGIEGIKVRITTKSESDAEAEATLSKVEEDLRPLLGDYLFGRDEETMETVVLDLLAAGGKTLAVAETLTTGLATHRLAQAVDRAQHASRTFLGGQTLAGIDMSILGLPAGASPIGMQAAAALASHSRKTFDADIGIAAVGNPGPGERDGLAPGTVHLVVTMGDQADHADVKLPGDGNRVRQYAVISLLNMLRLRLSKGSP